MNDSVLLQRKIDLGNNCFFTVLTLNRPKALNALNFELVHHLQGALNEIKQDNTVVAVLLLGEGERGFCAGGDIKELYASVKDSQDSKYGNATEYFAAEYRLDYALHTFPKPIVAWGHGVVMGGGIGLFQGCDFRVVDSSSKLAMPEVTIGLFPDVGVSYLFNQFPQPWGRFFSLTGAVMNAAEAVELGLANVFVDQTTVKDFEQALIQQTWSHEVNSKEIIAKVFASMQQGEMTSRLAEVKPVVEQMFLHTSVEELYSQAQKVLESSDVHPWLQQAFKTMLQGSPFAVYSSDQALNLTRSMSLKEVFDFDLMYMTHMVNHADFSEGVRALLIDKDKQPQWQYSSVNDVSQEALKSLLIAPWEIHPLHDLL